MSSLAGIAGMLTLILGGIIPAAVLIITSKQCISILKLEIQNIYFLQIIKITFAINLFYAIYEIAQKIYLPAFTEIGSSHGLVLLFGPTMVASNNIFILFLIYLVSTFIRKKSNNNRYKFDEQTNSET